MKKFLSLLMVLSVFAALLVVPAYAAGESFTTALAVPETVAPGETVTVTVTATNTSAQGGLLSFDGKLSYPSSVLTYSSVELGTETGSTWVKDANAVNGVVRLFAADDSCAAPVSAITLKVTFTVSADAASGTALSFGLTEAEGSSANADYITGTSSTASSRVYVAPPVSDVKTVGTGGDYKNLSAAFAAAKAGDKLNLKLISNVTDSSRGVVAAGAEIVLDLNGFTAHNSNTAKRNNITVNGTLTVKGEGTLSNETTHIIVVNEGGVLTVEDSTLVAGGTGYAVYNYGGTVAALINGTFRSPSNVAVYSASAIGTITGGTFEGTKGLHLFSATVNGKNYHGSVESINGAAFTGTANGIFVKSLSTIGSIAEATITSNGAKTTALYNSGVINTIADSTIVSEGGSYTIVNAGATARIGAINNTKITLNSATIGAGNAIYNTYGTIGTLDANTIITANSYGIFNKATINNVYATINTERGYGIYMNTATSHIDTVNATITSNLRSAILLNSGATIGTVNGKLTVTGSDTTKCIGLSVQTGAKIDTLNAEISSYATAVSNNGSTIGEITGGTYTSAQTYAVTNFKNSTISSISGGTFTGLARGLSNNGTVSSISGGAFLATAAPANANRAIYTASGATTTIADGKTLSKNASTGYFEVA